MNTPSESKWTPSLWLLAVLALAFFGIRTISHGDFWIHLATGRHLAEKGWLLSDPFSFATDPSLGWVNPSWMYDWLLYRIWQLGGAVAVSLLFIACVISAFALVRTSIPPQAVNAHAALALLLVSWLVAPNFQIAPWGPALLFFSVFVASLHRGIGRADWVALPALQVLWTNMHPSFALGPLTALLFALDRNRPGRRLYVLMSIACAATTFVNPYGWRLHQLAYRLLFDANMGALLDWISPFQADFAMFALRTPLLVSLVAIMAGFIVIRGSLPWVPTTLGCLGALLCVLSPRYWAFGALFIFPFCAVSLEALGHVVQRRIQWNGIVPVARWLIGGLAVAMMAMSCSGYYLNRIGSASSFGLGVTEDAFPTRACESILARPDFPARAINFAHDGGYLAWALPNRKIFCDTRVPVFGTAFYHKLARGLYNEPEILTNLIQRFDPGAFILSGLWPGSGYAAKRLIESGQWIPAYFDGTTIIFLRNSPENSRLLGDSGLQAKGLEIVENARRAYKLELESPMPVRNHPRLIAAGYIYGGLARTKELRAVTALTTRGSPTHAPSWGAFGIASAQLGNYAEAAVALKRAIRLKRQDALYALWLALSYEKLGKTAEAAEMRDRARRINPRLVESFDKEFDPRWKSSEPKPPSE
ncbi:MAG: tetratricopeptide repeat protein [Kiritimatiellae bacterium]|nr:tetratricopeptide repeat protein [Kiritimatiellia bacterium]MDW8458623.1 tetratricopeptide repeat protein [Verrucomicrobiota bacterium]